MPHLPRQTPAARSIHQVHRGRQLNQTHTHKPRQHPYGRPHTAVMTPFRCLPYTKDDYQGHHEHQEHHVWTRSHMWIDGPRAS